MLDDMNHQDTGCSGGWVVVNGIAFSVYQLTVTKKKLNPNLFELGSGQDSACLFDFV